MLDERILPINLEKLSATVLALCRENRPIIAVGGSAEDITRFWPESQQIIKLPVRTVGESRSREKRVLEADKITLGNDTRYFIDDVAVSGTTLAVARQAIAPVNDDDTAVIGMAWDSKRLRRRVGMEIEGAIVYRQAGGGVPAVNTVSSLAFNSGRRKEYAARKFGDGEALEEIVEIYRRAES